MRWDRQNLFVIAGLVSTYFTTTLPGFQMLLVIAEFVIAGCHCNVPVILLCMQMTLILVQLQKTQTSLNLKIVNDYINLISVYTITIDYLNV